VLGLSVRSASWLLCIACGVPVQAVTDTTTNTQLLDGLSRNVLTAAGVASHSAPAASHLCAHSLAFEEGTQREWETREIEVKPGSTPAAGACACLLAAVAASAAGGAPAEAARGPAACERLLLLLLLLGQLLRELLLPGAYCGALDGGGLCELGTDGEGQGATHPGGRKALVLRLQPRGGQQGGTHCALSVLLGVIAVTHAVDVGTQQRCGVACCCCAAETKLDAMARLVNTDWFYTRGSMFWEQSGTVACHRADFSHTEPRNTVQPGKNLLL
jgi:hypothetical protein